MTLKRFQQESGIPERFKTEPAKDMMRTPATTPPMFKTSYSEFGQFKPNIHTTPRSYHGLNTRFTAKMTKHGMYRNHSVNL